MGTLMDSYQYGATCATVMKVRSRACWKDCQLLLNQEGNLGGHSPSNYIENTPQQQITRQTVLLQHTHIR